VTVYFSKNNNRKKRKRNHCRASRYPPSLCPQPSKPIHIQSTPIMAVISYCVEYAESQKSTCLKCNKIIPNKSLRCGRMERGSEKEKKKFAKFRWYHFKCFEVWHRKKNSRRSCHGGLEKENRGRETKGGRGKESGVNKRSMPYNPKAFFLRDFFWGSRQCTQPMYVMLYRC